MKFGSGSDLIIACSSGESTNSAISVIRIDGFSSVSLFDNFFERKLNSKDVAQLKINAIIHEGNVIDQIMAVHFSAPKTYTGNNMLELHVHGNRLNVRRIIDLFCQTFRARRAEPGEFTLRALKNRKLTLSQVEGLDILLNANTSLAFSSGLSLLNGELKEAYLSLYDRMVRLLAAVELFIDFSEDVGHERALENYERALADFSYDLNQLASRVQTSGSSLLDPTIVIYGKTNSGKSTLFNGLLGRDRSIVSNIEGTTRDYVVEPLSINGETFRLTDTAGIRETLDPIEEKGIELSKKLLEQSFFKILVASRLELGLYSAEDFKRFDLVCITHSDQVRDDSINFKDLGEYFILNGRATGPIEPPTRSASGPIEPRVNLSGSIGPSWRYDESQLLKIKGIIAKRYTQLASNSPILSSRQIDKINEILSSHQEYVDQYAQVINSDPAVAASELGRIKLKIEELLGIITPDVVLDKVFKNFCIGK